MKIEIPELEELKSKVELLTEQVLDLRQIVIPRKSWWNLKDACQLKGIAYQTALNKKKL